MNTTPVQIPSIPEEIIFEILKRLPVKTLCRFRTISKLWFSIITSRVFIDSHFEHSKLKPEFLFGFYNKDGTTQLKPPTFFSTNYPQTADKWGTYYPCCSISPRGLICFYDSLDGAVQIWNPSTGERVWVNPPQHQLPNTRSAFFLGFDPVGKKHKLLSYHNREYYLLTLGEKKKWTKIISTDCRASVISTNQNHCFIDGMLYYFARSDQHEFVLAAFDVRSENFLETIRLPEKVARVGGLIRVYRGKIVLLLSSLQNCFTHEMWVLEDVQKQKWILMRSISRPYSSSRTDRGYKVGVIDGEELVLYSEYVDANSGGFRLCFYDLEKSRWTETQHDFRAEELDGSVRYEVRLYYYVDNLESLKSRTLSILEKKIEEKVKKKKKNNKKRKRAAISFFNGG